jgi:formate dehydrogenase major subunit
MTNHWIDIRNSDCILIMGSNAAENHPISMKWVGKATENGATLISVDPRFTRTSSKADIYAPMRSGTDIAFLGGMMNYILTNKKYHKEYAANYTNASFILGPKYDFKDGLFAGFDPKKKKSRYTPEKVSAITGTPVKDLKRVWGPYAKTGAVDKTGTVMYAMGWTQHTVGVQNIRMMAMIQLILGNMGRPGGGVNALRGESNVQGSTDHCLLFHIWPGYLGTPKASLPTLAAYNKKNTPKTNDPLSANWWQHKPKYMASFLKSMFGQAATAKNETISATPGCRSWMTV